MIFTGANHIAGEIALPRRRTVLTSPLVAAAIGGLARQAVAAPVRSVPYRWRNAVVGAGGFAPGIVFSTAAAGLAYLRTDMGGAYRWQADAGTWVPLQDQLAQRNLFGIESIAPDPVAADILYMAAGTYLGRPAAMMRSRDRGDSWEIFPVSFRMGGNAYGRSVGERLAVDPQRRGHLLFGSREEGLQRSIDYGASWQRCQAFPWSGVGQADRRGEDVAIGISFVIFDPAPGSRRVFAGIADTGAPRIAMSADGGESWTALAGGPPADLIPVKAAIDGQGTLYVTCSDKAGPSGITRGAVWRLRPDGGWSDITPDKRADAPAGGYMGVAADRSRPGRVLVTTIDRWRPGDTIWHTRDGGDSWEDLGPRSTRDVGISPFLMQDEDHAELGHWLAGLAIDPFDGSRAAYTTGATVYRTDELDAKGDIRWRPWVAGIEQTAIISLLSPPGGAPLVSGFGDIAGFVHDDLQVSPPRMHLNPHLTNTNNLDYAGLHPDVLVRSGNRHGDQVPTAALAWSEDGGRIWNPLRAKLPAHEEQDRDGQAHVVAGADGRTFAVSTPVPLLSRDRGESWQAIAGLPERGRPVADKQDPRLFYALDFERGLFLRSEDHGRSFAPTTARGLPADLSAARPRSRETPYPLIAWHGARGALWLKLGERLYRSTDAGDSWTRIGAAIRAELFALGRPASGSQEPTLFVAGEFQGQRGLFRQADGDRGWLRIDDDAHRWGHEYRVIEGDPKVFGRLYVGTNGRGILYGDPVFHGKE